MADEDLSKLKIDKSGAVYRPRRRKRSMLVIAALLCTVIIFLLYSFVLNPSVEVEIATVTQAYPSQAFTLLNASGYVVAQRKAAVASKITSRLVSLTVEEGSRVKKGEVIARLEGDDAVAARQQAAANLNVARSNLEQANAELNDAALLFNRNKDLVSKGYISRAEYDSAEARYKKAVAAVGGAEAAIKASSAALRSADVALAYTLIRAPFDAVVLTKNADIGDIITPLGAAANAKASVVTIADLSSLQVEVDVSESNLEKVKMGQPSEIQLDAIPGLRFQGDVHMIVPTADRTKASVLIKVRFLEKDSRILPEMSAKVAFLERPVSGEERQPKTALNPAAVVTRNGNKIVFLVKGEQVKEVPVKTGAKIGDVIEVIEGVKAGDKIVVNPPKKLKDGLRVTIKEK